MASEPVANISQAGVLQGLSTGTSTLYASYIVTALLLAFFAFSSRDKYPDVPWLNPKGPTELTASKQRAEFLARPRELLKEGSERFKDKPYKLNTENGPVLMLPRKYVNELKSDRTLDFMTAAQENSHTYLPGFEPMLVPMEMPQIISRHLTKTLLSLTEPLSLETTQALKNVFKEDYKGWTLVTPADVMHVVSRISSRIFMGEDLCADQEWIKASSAYVNTIFQYSNTISSWPRSLRRILHFFHPTYKTVKSDLKRCQDVLQPHLDKRNAVIRQAEARGEKNPYDDAIEWFDKETKGKKMDAASAQIALSLVAIHTTTDLLTQALIDLARYPEFVAPLRQEVIEVLGTHGLTKMAFQKLNLMDSCLKESQRLRPIFNVFFIRAALKDVTLSDGFVIKKGTSVATDSSVFMDEEIYPEPHRYNPYRFMEMRQIPGEENKAHLVSVTLSHPGFGHGIHACPGRFFAANEVKIALAHILLKYEWKFADGAEDLHAFCQGINLQVNAGTKLVFRRRQEELDLDSLKC